MSNTPPGVKPEIEITSDAACLPSGFVKSYSQPRATTKTKSSDDYKEELLLEIQRNGREKIRVTRSTASWGGVFVCLRFWEREDDGSFQPSKREINIRLDNVEPVATAMLEALNR